MNRERQQRRRRHREEQERIESEISLLERRLTSLRLQLPVNQREQQAQEQQDRRRERARQVNRPQNEETVFVIGSRVQITNRQDDLYGQEGVVTKVSRGNHFIYFRLANGTVRYRGPQNLLVITNQQDE